MVGEGSLYWTLLPCRSRDGWDSNRSWSRASKPREVVGTSMVFYWYAIGGGGKCTLAVTMVGNLVLVLLLSIILSGPGVSQQG
jgi:hypothetical protein